MIFIPLSTYKYPVLDLPQIKHVHVEITTRCNARCPMCPRNYRGMDFNSGYPLTELRLEDFKKIFQSAFLKQLWKYPKQGMTFNGNLGDFAAAKDAFEIVEYVTSYGVGVTVNTNGSLRSGDWWAKLARPQLAIGFAIDGLVDTHSLYRQDTDWKKVLDNATAFIRAGGRAIWRFIPFEHNQHQEAECRKLARDLGFSQFQIVYDGRDHTPVFSREGNFTHWIGQSQAKYPHPSPIEHLLEDHRNSSCSTQSWEHDGINLRIDCKHINERSIYVAADGSVYPCCFLGFYPQSMTHPGNEQIQTLVKENNALEFDLEHCLNWFRSVQSTWSIPSVREGRLYQCAATCGQKISNT